MVEDHAAFAQAMEMVMIRTGRFGAVVLAGTLQEARSVLDGYFDAAVVDLMLPDGDGTSLVRELKTRRPEMPVLVLSAKEDLSDALEAGADAAVNKSASMPKVIEALDRLTEH